MRPSSANRENLIPIGNIESRDQITFMESKANQVKHYIGTIEIPGIAKGTACLLKNGKILTCLHNILDYGALAENRAQLIDFSEHDVSVYFVKNDNIYKYKINSAPVSGLNKLKSQGASAWCFDYALLEAEGNPVRDLGGGFKPDKTDHFGSASVTDPMRTLAISGPFVSLTETGEVKFHRFASLSANQAAEGGSYHITQAGDHPSAPGFSGMAIAPIDRSYSIDTLYAIHSYRDNQGQQTGAKISEIRSSIRDQTRVTEDVRLNDYVVHTLRNWYEALRRAKIMPNTSVTAVGDPIGLDEAIEIMARGGNIIGDSKKETRDAVKTWVSREGIYDAKDIIEDPIHPSAPNGLPHFHHPSHTSAHAFFGLQEQQQKLAAEQRRHEEAEANRKRQLEATKKLKQEKEAAAKESSSKAEKIRKEREDKGSGKNSKKSGGRF